ncbi:MAG: cupin domain-containing protein [Treponema sp.]|jgi:mannose-6-phosphate isomerase-like protein (cupin superfamily)|nr:cupin domain-containing protein [Treponema sp.]
MVCQRSELKSEQREKPRNGTGTATYLHFVEGQGRTQKNVNLLAEITLPPGASVGPHSHTEDTEFFIILEGKGTVDDNGVKKPIAKGDVMVIGNGETHSVANTGNTPLVFHAVIIKDA